MSDPRYPDNSNAAQPPTTPQSEAWPADPHATPTPPVMPPGYPTPAPRTMPPGAYPPGTYPPGAYSTMPGGYFSPTPGQSAPPALPYYGPPAAPQQPGPGYPSMPPGVYPAPPSMPLPGQYSAPPSVPLPGYGAPAPVSQYGMPAAPPAPQIAPTPAIRQGFLVAGIGGAIALLAYLLYGVSWSGARWLVPALAALVAVLGFIPASRNRAWGWQTPRNGGVVCMAATALGVLVLFSSGGGLNGLSRQIIALGLVVGFVGGVLAFRATQPASASATASSTSVRLNGSQSMSSGQVASPMSANGAETTGHSGAPAPTSPQAPAIQTTTPSALSAPGQTSARSGQAGARGTTNGVLKGLGLGLVFIVEGWNLIYKIALVILVIVGAVIFIQSHIGLNEHSSCQQFEQADSGAQNQALQDMMNAHHDPGPASLTRASLRLYCAVEGPSAPIDGIYTGGHISQQPALALRPRHQ